MIKKILRKLWRLTPWDKLPRAPRMFATEYDRADKAEARVMARLGIRSPSGLRVAMKRYNVETIDELVAELEHHQPRRRLAHRIKLMLARASGGTRGHPHAGEIYRAVKRRRGADLVDERVKQVKRALTTPHQDP